jgi:hypothetical protein
LRVTVEKQEGGTPSCRSFFGPRLMSRALEEEMKRRGGGYDYIAGAWRGTLSDAGHEVISKRTSPFK